MDANREVVELLHRGFLSMVFQPIVDLEKGGVAGYEALMRGPKGTILESPARVFGPLSPLSPETLVQLDAACIAAALRGGHLLASSAPLFINVEMDTLLQPREKLVLYERLLASSGVAPGRVVLEISERSTPQDPRRVSRILTHLRKAFGCRFALDDMGSAYSGLQHLLWFEPDFVKMDMSLVAGVHRSERKRAILAHTAAMALDVGCELIAEGVDNQDDLVALMSAGVPLAQGYHFGHPEEALYWREEAQHPKGFEPWFNSAPAPVPVVAA